MKLPAWLVLGCFLHCLFSAGPVARAVERHGVPEPSNSTLEANPGDVFGRLKEQVLVVIDPAIPDAGSLVAGLRADLNVTLLVLDPNVDGLEQVTRVLGKLQGIGAIHIVSHGSPGALRLGDRQYGVADLQSGRPLLSSWKRALTNPARIVLYGCEIGRGQGGRAFLDQLADCTEVPVSASSRVMGRASREVSWDLDVSTDGIHGAGLAFTAQALAGYSGTLADTVVFTTGNATASEDKLFTVVQDGSNRTVLTSSSSFLAGPTRVAVDRINRRIYVCDDRSGSGGIYRFNADGTGKTTIYANTTSNTRVTGVAVDSTHGLVYFTSNGTSSQDKLFRSDLNGGNRVVLTSSSSFMRYPGALAVDEANQRIYVCNEATSTSGGIYRFDANGGGIKTIYKNPSSGPLMIGVAVDSTTGLVYFMTSRSSAADDKLFRSDLEGANRVVLLSGASLVASPGQLVVDSSERRLIVCDVTSGAGGLYRFNLDGTGKAGIYTNTTSGSLVVGVSLLPFSPTTVTSILLANATPSAAATVQWTVTFGTNVAGLAAQNFTLAGTAATGATVGTPITANNGLTWTVPVTTGPTSGTLQLNLTQSGGLTPSISTALPFNGSTYTMDKSPPSITIANPSTFATATGPVTYAIAYADDNFSSSTLSAANITLNRSGTANGVVGVTGSGTNRTVTISSVTGDGTLSISIAAGTATDTAGNAAPAAGPSKSFSAANAAPSAPVLTGILTDTGVSSTDEITSDPTLILVGSVQGTGLITVTRVGTGVIGTTNGDGSGNWQFNYTGTSLGNGSYSFSATQTDGVGNVSPISVALPVVIDVSPPSISLGAPSATLTQGGPVTYTVTYADTGFNASTLVSGNVTLNRTGTANGSIVISGSGLTRTVTVTNLTGDGSLGISIASGTATDLAGNSAAAAGPSATFVVDNTPPSVPKVTGIAADTGTSATDEITSDQTLVISGTADPNVLVSVSINDDDAGDVTANGSGNWTLDYTGTPLEDGDYTIVADAVDPAGNTSEDSTEFVVVVDTETPTVTLGGPSAALTRTGPVTYAVTYGDAHFNSSTLVSSNITLNKTGTANGTVAISGTGANRTVSISSTTGDGTLGISIAANTATDLAGNAAGPAGPSVTFAVDNLAPTAPVITGVTADTGTSATDQITSDTTLVLSGTSEANATVTLTRVGTGVIGTAAATAGGSWTFDYTNTTLAAGSHSFTATATDAAGNISPASTAFAVTVDTAAPAVAIGAPSSTLTRAGPVTYVVTYSDANLGTVTLAAGHITLNKTGTANGTVSVSGTGTTRTVSISSISGEGTLGVSIAAGTAGDLAGNSAAAAGPSAVFTVDNSPPSAPLLTAIVSDTGSSATDRITSDTTLVLSGTAETNATIAVTRTGTGVLGTTNANASGVWSYDYTATTLAPGGYSFTATATDAAGNSSAASSALAVTIDTAAPVVTIGSPSASVTRTGPITYLVTYSDSNPGTVTLATGNITLNKTSTANGTIGVSGTGTNRTVSISGITGNGTLSISIAGGTATDLAGNSAGAAGPSVSVAVDNAAPTAPTFTAITTDTGLSATDQVTSDTTLLLAGTAEAGATVTLTRVGTGVLGSSIANASGAWSYDYTGTILGAGTNSFTATATDAAGNTGPATAPFAVVIDITAPPAPLITQIADDTGSSSVDGVTGDPTLVFSGTAEPASRVSVTRVGAGGIGTITTDPSGHWTFDYSAMVLADGSYQFTAVATDLAGNVSPSSATFGVVIDSTTPAAPLITSLAADTGSSASDQITSDTTIVISGKAEIGSVVSLSREGAGLVGTSPANAGGDWSYDYSGTSLTNGTYTFTAVATDAAGHVSVPSAPFRVIVDTLRPAILISGPSVTQTAVGPVTYTVTYGDANLSAITLGAGNVTLNRGGTADGSMSVSGSGATRTVTLTGITGNGTLGISIAAGTASDVAGNLAGAAGPSATVAVDNTPPLTPGLLGITTDTGRSGSDRVTSDPTLVLNGTAEAGTTVTITRVGIGIVGTAVVEGSGQWSFDYTGTSLVEGTYEFEFVSTDVSGNTSPRSAVTAVTVDSQAPGAPVLVGITPDSGESGSDGITRETALKLSGTAEAGSLVRVMRQDVGELGTVLADAVGSWEFEGAGTNLVDGEYHFTARATDLAGNEGPDSADLKVEVDTTAPAVAVVSAINPDTGRSTSDGITANGAVVLSGTAEGGTLVTITRDGNGVSGTARADGSGNWSFDESARPLIEGITPFQVNATDLAGNVGTNSAEYRVELDLTPPAVTLGGPSVGSTSVGPVTYSVTYTDGGFDRSTLTGGGIVLGRVGSANAVVTVSGSGAAWTVTLSGISGDGSLAISVVGGTAVDVAGNLAGGVGPSLEVKVDNTAPSVPTIAGVSVDTGSSDSDRITSDSTLVLVGQATPEAGVAITRVGVGVVGTVTADAGGVWSLDYTGTVLADGSHGFTAVASDGVGNASGASGVLTVTVDTVAPGAPEMTVSSGDTGRSATDQITAHGKVIFSGTAEAGSTVSVSEEGIGEVGSAVADGNGEWSLDHSETVLAEGVHRFSATATDVAGNTGVASVVLELTVDLTAPVAPEITGIESDTGSLSDDEITSDTRLIFHGLAEAGSVVTISRLDTNVLGSVTADGSGSWTFDATAEALTEGEHGFAAVAVDVAGNVSDFSARFGVIIDGTAPTVTVSGPSHGATSSAPITYTVGYTDTHMDSSTLSAAEIVLNATGTAGGVITVSGSGLSRLVTIASITGNGTLGITIGAGTAVDLAGNSAGAAGPSETFVVDNTPPLVVVFTQVTSDTGRSATDEVTRDTTLLLSGVAGADDLITVSRGDVGVVGTTNATAAGEWTFDATGTVLGDGTYTFTATATDGVGNVSPPSLPFPVTIDTGAPGAPVIGAISTDTGHSSTDRITQDTTLVLFGEAEAGSEVTVSREDLGVVETVVADGAGEWSLDYSTTALSDGIYRFSATATDVAGNTGPVSGVFEVVVDTTAPAAPVVSGVESDSGESSSDQVTSDASLMIVGSAEPGSVVLVSRGGYGLLGVTTADGGGEWRFDYTGTSLGEGSERFSAHAVDEAGNKGPESAMLEVTLDYTAPTVSIGAPTAQITGSGPVSFAVSYGDMHFGVSTLTAANITLNTSGNVQASVGVSGSGTNYVVSLSGISGDGSVGISIGAGTAVDVAGNSAPGAGPSGTVRVDNGVPEAPVMGAITSDTGESGSDGVTSDTTLVLLGRAEAGNEVSVTRVGLGVIGTVVANGVGDWSLDYTGTVLGEGVHTFSATAVDEAGNTSAPSGALVVTVDTTAPEAPAITGIEEDTGGSGTDGVSSDSTLILKGRSEGNARVSVTRVGVGLIGVVLADGNGDWALDYRGVSLSEGTHRFGASAVDVAGNSGAGSAEFEVRVDTTPPGPPTLVGITNDTGTASDDEITNDATLEIFGTAEAGSTVTISESGVGVIGTTTSDGLGEWRFDHTATPFGEGTHELSATVSDGAGNISGLSESLVVLVDTSGPTVTMGSPSASITSHGPVTYEIRYEDAQFEECTLGATDIVLERTGDADGTVSVSGSGQTRVVTISGITGLGTLGISVGAGTARDLAGNESGATGPGETFGVDTVAPAPGEFSGISEDTGVSDADGLTGDATLEILGRAEPDTGITVVRVGVGVIGTTRSDGSGNWRLDYTGTALEDGPHQFLFASSDDLGNASPGVSPLHVTVDTSGPAIVLSDPSQAITSTGPVSYSVTYSDPAFNSSTLTAANVTLNKTGTADGIVVIGGAGATRIVTVTNVTGNGTLGISIAAGTASDLAGNLAGIAGPSVSFLVDTAPPSLLISGPSVSLTAVGPVTYTVTYGDPYLSAITLGAGNVTLNRGGTADGSVSVSGSGSTRTVTLSGITGNGTLGISIAEGTASDVAGNLAGAAGPSATVAVDNTPPLTPGLLGITTDTGRSGSDRVTSDPTLVLNGTAEAGTTVTITRVGIGIVGTAVVEGSGQWSFDYTGTSLVEGTYEFEFVSTDVSGNTSPRSAVSAVTVDSQAPGAPVLVGITPDSGESGSDGITRATALKLSGTAEAGSLVRVMRQDVGELGTVLADAVGSWEFEGAGTNLVDGEYHFTARATDLAGNEGPDSADLKVEVDTTAPAVAVVSAINPDTGRSTSDGITANGAVVLSGTAEAGALVTITRDGNGVSGTARADGSGNWSFDESARPLIEGITPFQVNATDLAGNVGTNSGEYRVELDLTPPGVTLGGPSVGSTSVGPVTYSVTYTDGGFDRSTLTGGGIVLGRVGSANAVVTVSGSGAAWTVTLSGISGDGSLAISVVGGTAVDVAGNLAGGVGPSLEVKVDNTAPSVPTIVSVVSDTGVSDSDRITSDATLVLVGQATPEAGVAITRVGVGVVGTVTADAGGVWSFDYTGTVLGEGAHGFTAVASDGVGNASAASGVFTVTVDRTAPVAPDMEVSSGDSGESGSDRITANGKVIFSGTAEVGSTVSVSEEGIGVVGSAVADGNGEWSLDHSETVLAEGVHRFSATATDVSGNTGAASAELALTVDLTAPGAPEITGIESDTGALSDDEITSDTRLIFHGLAEAGSLVTLTRLDTNVLGSVTADGSGSWTFDATGQALAEGEHGFAAVATDVAGNVSDFSARFGVIIDVTAPTVTVSGPSQRATSSAPITYTVGYTDAHMDSSTLGAGDITLNATGSASGVITVTGSGLNRQVTIASITGNGTLGISIGAGTGVDLAGNSAGAKGPSETFVVDNTPPLVVVFTQVTSDTGRSATDEVTRDTTLLLSGVAEADDLITVSRGDVGVVGTTNATAAGEWTFDATGTVLADGTYTFTATATDGVGNVSPPSLPFPVTIDTGAPGTPVIGAISTDTGHSSTDGITQDTTLVLFGEAEAGSEVTVSREDIGVVETVMADGAGEWSLDYSTTALSDGIYRFSATATDVAGNTGPVSGVFEVVVDTTAPGAPVVSGVESDSGASSSDQVTSDASLMIVGSAEPGSVVLVSRVGYGLLGVTTADGSGEWRFDYTGTTLGEGSERFTASALDEAGNQGPESAALAVTLDFTAPTVSIGAPTAQITGSGPVSFAVSYGDTYFEGSTLTAANITLNTSGNVQGSVGVTGGGRNYVVTLSGISGDGSVGISIGVGTAVDVAGNSALSAGPSATVTVDNGVPEAPVWIGITSDTGESGSDGVTSDTTLVLLGRAEAGNEVSVTRVGLGVIGTVVANGAGDWSLDYTGTVLGDGVHEFTARSVDEAGNTSAPSGALVVTVDTTAPEAPAITGIEEDTGGSGTDGVSSDSTLILKGRSEGNARVSVTRVGVGVIGTVTADGNGDWALDYRGVSLSEGMHRFGASAVDVAGNSGAGSAEFEVRVDTTPPGPPTLVGITNDTGTASDDEITNDATLEIFGTAEAGSTVTISESGVGVIGTTTSDGLGEWRFDNTGAAFGEGTHELSATVSDGAGNISGLSESLVVLVDTSGPTVTMGSPSASITSHGPVTYEIRYEDAQFEECTLGATDIVLERTGDADGTVSVSGSGQTRVVTISGITGLGTLGISVGAGTARDLAGNESGATGPGETFGVDTVAPAPGEFSGISEDTGVSDTDGLTGDATLEILGRAEADTGITVVRVGVGVIGTTRSDGSGNWRLDYTGTALEDGPHQFLFTSSDDLGNASPGVSPLHVTVDTVAPVTTISGPSESITSTGPISYEVRYSDTDFNSSTLAVANVTLNKTGTADGTVSVSGAGTNRVVTISSITGNGTLGISIAEGTASDVAGNLAGAAGPSGTVAVDNTPPLTPGSLEITTDTGRSGSDRVTSDPTLVLNGTAEAGTTVTITRVGIGIVGTAVVEGSGQWSFDYTGTSLVEGTYEFEFVSTDVSGNTSPRSAVTAVTVDSQAPGAPVLVGITPDSGESGSDGITRATALKLSGTAEAGSLVRVMRQDVGELGTVLADAVGSWEFEGAGTNLVDGEYHFTARATDLAGNEGPDSADLKVEVDTTAPAVAVVSAINPDTGRSTSDGITANGAVVLSGTAEGGTLVTITRDGNGVSGTARADGSGNWSFDESARPLIEGITPFQVNATDLAGNVGTNSAEYRVELDLTPPAVTLGGPSVGSTSVGPVTYSVTYTDGGFDRSTLTGGGIVLGRVGSANAVVTVSGSGAAWTVTLSGISGDGSLAISVVGGTAVDVAGNLAGGVGPSLEVKVDNTAPSVPTIAGVSVDTGSSDSDRITSDSTLVLVGQATPEAGVAITRVGVGVVGTVTADAGGVWSLDYTGTVLADGSHGFTAVASDGVGNASGASGVLTVTVDTVAPGAPEMTVSSGDTGRSATDQITAHGKVIFSGTAEAGSTVSVSEEGIGEVGSAVADGNGEWSLDHSETVLAEGVHRFSATATDVAGNTGVASVVLELTVDLTAPVAPEITGIESDTGSLSDDEITSDTRLIFHGLAEAGSVVTISRLDTNVLGSVTADGSGSWTFDATAEALTEGEHGFAAVAVDVAGNVSDFSARFGVIIDGTAPTVTVSGPSHGATSSAPITYTVGYTDTHMDSSTLSAAEIVLNATGTAGGVITVSGSGLSRLVTIASITGNGTLGITIGAGTAVDLAGNSAGAAGPSETFVVDTSAPTVVINRITSDTGSSATDQITRDTTLLISGVAEPNDLITVSRGDVGVLGTTNATAAGEWTFDATGTVLGDGTYTFTATATDGVGNVSPPSLPFPVTIDTGAPGAPVIGAISTDTGHSSTDRITQDTTLVLFGEAEAGSEVTVSREDLGVVETVVADGAGEWSLDYSTTALSDGIYRFSATATDVAGNTGPVSGVFEVVVDTTAPAAPVVSGVESDSGESSSDQVTSDASLMIVGSAEPGSVVLVSRVGYGLLGVTTADGSGEWRFDYTGTTLGEGSERFSASALDEAGNQGPESGAMEVTLDFTAPTVSIGAPTAQITGSGPVSFAVSYGDMHFGVSTLTAANITLNTSGNVQASVGVSGSGTSYVVSLSGISGDGSVGISIGAGTAVDVAGNSAPGAGPSGTVRVDNGVPEAPVMGAITSDTGESGSDGVTSDTTLVLLGRAEAGNEVSVTRVGLGVIGTVVANGVGDWSLDYTGTVLGEGVHTFSATAVDEAGNTSAPSGALVVTVDTTAPEAPAITGIEEDTGGSGTDGVSSDSTLILKGRSEGNARVSVTRVGVGLIGVVLADGNGDWALDYRGVSLSEGTHRFGASAVDVAGNSGPGSVEFEVRVDTTPPGPPTLVGITNDTGTASDDEITNDATLEIFGTAEAGSTVTISESGVGVIGTTTSDGLGEWRFDHTATPFGEGTHELSATVSDGAGNISGLSESLVVLVDTSGPTVTMGSPSASITSHGPVTYEIRYEDAQFEECTLGATDIVLERTGDADGTVSVSGSGQTRVVTISGITGLGTLGISVGAGTARDLAGNESGATGPGETFGVDTVAPAPGEFSGISADTGVSDTDGLTGDATLEILGRAEPDTGITVVRVGVGVIGTTRSDGSGNWRLDYTGTALEDGPHQFLFTSSDDLGNASPGVSPLQVDVDTAAPAIVVSAPSLPVTTLGPVTYDITYLDLNFKESTLSAADIVLNAIGTASASVSVEEGTNATRRVILFDITGSGTLGITIRSNTASDSAGNLASGSNPSATFVVNGTPAANPDQFNRPANFDLKILITALLANDTDPEGDPLALMTFDSVSAQGGSVTRRDKWLLYSLPSLNTTDTFHYVVGDGHGSAATGTVTVLIATPGNEQSRNIVSISADGPDMLIQFAGVPGVTYAIQYTTSLESPVWTTLATLTASSIGIIEYRDVSPTGPARYYRTLVP